MYPGVLCRFSENTLKFRQTLQLQLWIKRAGSFGFFVVSYIWFPQLSDFLKAVWGIDLKNSICHFRKRNHSADPAGTMKLIVFRDKNRFRIREVFDQLHAFVKSQRKTDRAQCVAVCGIVANDGNAKQIVFVRIAGCRV